MMTMANVDAKLISTLKDMATPTSWMTIQGIFNNVMYGNYFFPFCCSNCLPWINKSAGALNKEDKENTDNTIE